MQFEFAEAAVVGPCLNAIPVESEVYFLAARYTEVQSTDAVGSCEVKLLRVDNRAVSPGNADTFFMKLFGYW